MTQVFFSPAPLAACALGVLLYNMSAIQYQSDLRTGCSRIADVVKTIPARSLCRSVQSLQCTAIPRSAHDVARWRMPTTHAQFVGSPSSHQAAVCRALAAIARSARMPVPAPLVTVRYRALSHTRRTVLRAVYCSKQLTPGPLDRLMPQARQHLRPAATEATCLRPCSALRQR